MASVCDPGSGRLHPSFAAVARYYGVAVDVWDEERIAEAATRRIGEGRDESGELAAKLMRARFFAERMLPETALRLTRIKASADSVMALEEQWF